MTIVRNCGETRRSVDHQTPSISSTEEIICSLLTACAVTARGLFYVTTSRPISRFQTSPSPKSGSKFQASLHIFQHCCVVNGLCFRFVDEMSKLNENTTESFAINEAHEFEKRQHCVTFDEKSFSGRLQRKHSFRLWHILLFLFVVAAIIALVGLFSSGVLRGKKAAASDGRKHNKHFNNLSHKSS